MFFYHHTALINLIIHIKIFKYKLNCNTNAKVMLELFCTKSCTFIIIYSVDFIHVTKSSSQKKFNTLNFSILINSIK